MRNERQMLDLLKQKKEYFEDYEEETKRLTEGLEEGTEKLTKALEARQELIGKIDGIDSQVRRLCQESSDGKRMMDASKNRCEYDSLSDEYQEIYQAGQQIFQIIARVQQEEQLAISALRQQMDSLQGKIRQNQKVSKFAGYLKSMSYGEDVKKGFLYNEKR